MTQTEALKHLREVHALQGRDGCWDIDDYMLGLYNGLELALSIVENRECRYKQRPKSQPEQEPVAWMDEDGDVLSASVVSGKGLRNIPLYTTPPQRTWVNLTAEEIEDIRMEYHVADGVVRAGYERAIEAKLKEKNT